MIRAARFAASALISAGPLAGQTARGTVVDSASSQPIAGASVEFTMADGQLVSRQVSDDSGRFVLTVRVTWDYALRIQRVGFRAREMAPLRLEASRDTTLVLRLAAAAVELAPVSVSAARLDPYLEMRGFYQRQQEGPGHFLDPATVERLATKGKVAADLLDHIPGVSVVVASESGGIRVPQLRSCRPALSGGRSWGPEDSAFPQLYVDGARVGRDAFGWLSPGDMLAVEVFMGPAQIPLLYGGTDAPCGVILIWTKR